MKYRIVKYNGRYFPQVLTSKNSEHASWDEWEPIGDDVDGYGCVSKAKAECNMHYNVCHPEVVEEFTIGHD